MFKLKQTISSCQKDIIPYQNGFCNYTCYISLIYGGYPWNISKGGGVIVVLVALRNNKLENGVCWGGVSVYNGFVMDSRKLITKT